MAQVAPSGANKSPCSSFRVKSSGFLKKAGIGIYKMWLQKRGNLPPWGLVKLKQRKQYKFVYDSKEGVLLRDIQKQGSPNEYTYVPSSQKETEEYVQYTS